MLSVALMGLLHSTQVRSLQSQADSPKQHFFLSRLEKYKKSRLSYILLKNFIFPPGKYSLHTVPAAVF